MGIGKLIYGTFAGLAVALAGLTVGVQFYSTVQAEKPHPPIYRDVNGDGVPDEITFNKVWTRGFLWSQYEKLEKEVLFGVNIGGKTLYVPKSEFDRLKK